MDERNLLQCEFINFMNSPLEKFKIGEGNILKAIIFRDSKLNHLNTEHLKHLLYLNVAGCWNLRDLNT